jgi:hypothetical protein
MDFITAFLNSAVQEEIYMDIPYGYDAESAARKAGLNPSDPRLCLKLKKSIYGTKQAGRNWNRDVDNLLKEYKFKPLSAEHCLYFKWDQHKNLELVGLYGDDLVIAMKDASKLANFKARLKQRYRMNDLGQIKNILGMRASHGNGEIHLDMEAYIDKLLQKVNMQDATISDIPGQSSAHLSL